MASFSEVEQGSGHESKEQIILYTTALSKLQS